MSSASCFNANFAAEVAVCACVFVATRRKDESVTVGDVRVESIIRGVPHGRRGGAGACDRPLRRGPLARRCREARRGRE